MYQCTALTSIRIPEGVTSIGDNAIRATQISSVVIPKSVTSIGDMAFRDNYYMSDVLLMCDSTPTISATAFTKAAPYTVGKDGTLTMYVSNADVYTALCAMSFLSVKMSLIDGAPAAAIADSYYATLADAVAAVKSNETITLLSEIDGTDVTITLPDGVTKVTIKGESATEPVVINNLAGMAKTNNELTFENITFKQTSATLTMRGTKITFNHCNITGA